MEAVVLVIHLFLALAIIGLVLIQRSEGGGLGIGGGGGGMGGLATARGTANFLTRATGFCAAGFFCTSLALGVMAGGSTSSRQGLLEGVSAPVPAAEGQISTDENTVPSPEETAAPEAPAPSAPIAE